MKWIKIDHNYTASLIPLTSKQGLLVNTNANWTNNLAKTVGCDEVKRLPAGAVVVAQVTERSFLTLEAPKFEFNHHSLIFVKYISFVLTVKNKWKRRKRGQELILKTNFERIITLRAFKSHLYMIGPWNGCPFVNKDYQSSFRKKPHDVVFSLLRQSV